MITPVGRRRHWQFSRIPYSLPGLTVLFLFSLFRGGSLVPIHSEDAEVTAPAADFANPGQITWDSATEAFRVVETGLGRETTITPTGKVGRQEAHVVPGLLPATGFAVEAPNRTFTVVIDPWQPRALVAPRARSDLANAKLADCKMIPLESNPRSAAISADSNTIAIVCDPAGFRDRGLWIVDVKTGKAERRAIPGSSNLHGVALDPTGKFALVVHLLHKSKLPSTQIDQGWVFTNVITWVSLTSDEIVTFPLDLRTTGFANPEAVAIDPHGRWAYVAHGGADVISVLDLHVMDKLRAEVREQASGNRPGYHRGEDLRLTPRLVRQRISVGAQPCSLALSADGETLAVANRLSDSVSLIETKSRRIRETVLLSDLQTTLVRQGERLFHSGRLAFGAQFSCASCHPEGHTDGLNWDLPADGFNNFHNTKSLLSVAGTQPYGWLGETPTLTERFTGTLRQLFQYEPSDDDIRALEAYLQQLRYPASLPARVADDAPAVARGATLFRGKAGCANCHRGAQLTDHAAHDVGTSSDPLITYDTPSLLKVSETAPYLHDGRAASLEDIFTQQNPRKIHGNGGMLTTEELADLVAFLQSL